MERPVPYDRPYIPSQHSGSLPKHPVPDSRLGRYRRPLKRIEWYPFKSHVFILEIRTTAYINPANNTLPVVQGPSDLAFHEKYVVMELFHLYIYMRISTDFFIATDRLKYEPKR